MRRNKSISKITNPFLSTISLSTSVSSLLSPSFSFSVPWRKKYRNIRSLSFFGIIEKRGIMKFIGKTLFFFIVPIHILHKFIYTYFKCTSNASKILYSRIICYSCLYFLVGNICNICFLCNFIDSKTLLNTSFSEACSKGKFLSWSSHTVNT